MDNIKSNNKVIAKNTLFLYIRMIILTIINLYTVRITLEVLGIVDYGIYNVVGSIVASVSFITGTLTSASQRFLSYHLGKNDYIAYSKTFSLLFFSFLAISFLVIILGEIIGPFFINDWLKLPEDRISATKIVYQSVIFTFIFHFLTVPFTSSIVSHEKINAFAILTIIDGLMKLLLVYVLLNIDIDQLVLYGGLMSIQAFIMLISYWLYCTFTFKVCKIYWFWNLQMIKDIFTFTGWNLFGSLSGILSTQGQNILLNIFFGPTVNAAKAIGDKITGVIQSFSTNFYMAVSPQIVKSYASEDYERMINLGIKSSKLSFYMLYVISFPLICCMKGVLALWLGKDSNSIDMVGFANLSIICCLVLCLEQPITHMIRATGNI